MIWHFVGSCIDGQPFQLAGLEVWQNRWHGTDQVATVVDPHYGTTRQFAVY